VGAALAAGLLLCASAAPAAAAAAPSVTLAVLPRDTTVADLAGVPGISPGVMSAGIGAVPSEQTFLDVSQGNRVDDAVYDRPLPGLFPFAREVPGWDRVVSRADAAPADLAPGLLAARLRAAGIPVAAEQPMEAAAIAAAAPSGIVAPLRRGPQGLAVISAGVGELRGLVRRLRSRDLLIALAAPPPAGDRALAIGIAGRGFEGNLTSASTRTEGYLLSTDIAPTILGRFGLPVPDEMDGEAIRSRGSVDGAALEDLADRMAAVPARRVPVVVLSLVAWILVAAVVARAMPRARRTALSWLALAFAYMPLLLLAGAALRPGAATEGLLVGFGAAALAAVTLRLAPGWWALAIACAITVAAYAIDVTAGSGLTKLSLLGPNPIYGVRFYGIGNELEALCAVMVPVAVGAGLSATSGSRKPANEERGALSFLVAGLLAAVIFGAGRFGADVGAAIVFPLGAAVAAGTLLTLGPAGTGRRRGLATASVIAAPLIAVLSLALIDLASGANAHLTRSVLEAGGAGDLADLAQRRLALSAHDFAQAGSNPLFWVVVAGIAAAIWRRRRIDAWLATAPPARAGFLGACAAVAAGVLVNDSGATYLALGGLALGAGLAFARAQAGANP
jgi:hypothetical protein